MFALRRIAARAVFAQPARQLSTLRPAHPRISIFQTEQAALCRSFHQSRRWLAEKEEASPAEAEASDETVTTEPSAADLKENLAESTTTAEVVESEPSAADQKENPEQSTATADVVEQTEQKADDVLSRAQDAVSSAAETVRDMASNAAGTVSNAASTMTGGAQFPGSDNAAGTTIYIGNLFFQVTAPQLDAEFSRYGRIVQSRVVTDVRGQSKGFAFLEFATKEAADQAVQDMDQQPLEGRRMAVQIHAPRQRSTSKPFAGRRENSQPAKTLFIGNMSYQMSDKDLNDLFREIKNVLDVRVAIDRRSGQPRGFAHADFVDVDSAIRAKELLSQKVIYGRQLRVDYSASSAQTIQ